MLFDTDATGITLTTSRFKILDTAAVGVCEIEIEDIATGLSNLNMFGLQRNVFFPVAQAALEASVVGERTSIGFAREALLHNAAFAYSGSLGAPALLAAIRERFGLPRHQADSPAHVFARIFSTAERYFFHDHWVTVSARRAEPFSDWKSAAMTPSFARDSFLARYRVIFESGVERPACHRICQPGQGERI